MAANIPAKLKSLDIARFALRSSQLEKFKPVIAYWCDYYIVNQILTKGMHTEDDECMTYTTSLMDKLEKIKGEHPDEIAIHDDAAAQAYVEQFAYDIFEKGDKAMRTDTVTKQTADTLQAAITFLDLISIWKQGLPDVAVKSKYAKYHAVRIMKALRAGEDPNLTNPKPESPDLDPADPDVQAIDAAAAPPDASEPTPLNPPPPSVPALHTAHPPAPTVSSHEVSPLSPSPTSRPASTNTAGGYFPPVPTFTSPSPSTALPTVADDLAAPPPPPSLPSSPPAAPHDFYRSAPTAQPYSPPAPAPVPSTYAAPAPLPAQTYAPPPAPTQGYTADDAAMADAQKHARWAVSALQFEDVETAVKELRVALRALGAL